MNNSDVEKARSNLNISGYQHPSSTSSSNKSVYQTFNPKSKNPYEQSNKGTVYKTFTDKESRKKMGLTCIVCDEEPLYECNCEYKDKACKNNHVWYQDKGNIKQGDPHEFDT